MSITIDGSGTITGATTMASTMASPTLTTPALGTPASGVLTNCTGVTGALTAGTPLTQNPYAVATTITQAHGLGAIPNFGVLIYMECISADLGFTAGDRYICSPMSGTVGAQTTQFGVSSDATNLVMRTAANLPNIPSKTDGSGTTITAAKWKVIATPYKIT